MRRSTLALSSSLAAIGLSASIALAQQYPQSPASSASTTSTDESLDPTMANRPCRYLLRNGMDYLAYREYARALSLFRAVESRQNELNDSEVKTLKKGIALAQQGLREAVNTTKSAAQGKGRAVVQPGALALAKPATGPASANATASARAAAAPVDRLQLTSAEMPAPPPLNRALPALPAPIPAAVAMPEPEASAPALPEVKASAPLELPGLPEVAPSDPAATPARATPPVELPPTAPAAMPAEAPPPLVLESASPAPVELPGTSPAPVELPPTSPAPVELPPIGGAPAPVELPPIGGAPTPVELPPTGGAPVELPPTGPAPVELPPTSPAPAVPMPVETIPASSLPPRVAQATQRPDSTAPTQPMAAPEPPPAPEAPPARGVGILPPLPGSMDASRMGDSGGSILSPRLQREVEMLAQRPPAENRNPGDLGDPTAPSMPTQGSTRLIVERAPSPTEARPLRRIPVPEEWVPLGKREWDPNRKYWAAAGTCHMILYFQDPVLERYGQGVEQSLGPVGRYFSYPLDDPKQSNQRNQILQPFYSMGKFCFQVGTLPYKLIVDPPWEAEYDLGYYRPGDRIPADTLMITPYGVGPPGKGRQY